MKSFRSRLWFVHLGSPRNPLAALACALLIAAQARADADTAATARMAWGDARCCVGDVYKDIGPAWWVDACKVGGTWDQGTQSWHVDAAATGEAALCIRLDRARLTQDVALELTLLDHVGSVLRVDLLDATQTPVALDLFGNVLTGSGDPKTLWWVLPLATHPDATQIRLRRDSGEMTLHNSTLSLVPTPNETLVTQETPSAPTPRSANAPVAGPAPGNPQASHAAASSLVAGAAVETAPAAAATAAPRSAASLQPNVTISAPAHGSRILW